MSEKLKATPEARTSAFFNQDPYAIAQQMVEGEGMVIAVAGSEKRVRVVEAEPFEKRRVGARYAAMESMNPGDVWSPPQRQILQTLVVAKDKNGVGACIRIKEAEFYDPSNESFVSNLKLGDRTLMAREGDIAKYLGLERFERSRLRFQDSTEILYLVPDGEIVERIAPQEANRQLRGLLG